MSEVFLKLHIEALDEGGYVATSPDLPGLVAQGRTLAETTEIAHDVARKLIDSYKETGIHCPSALENQTRKSTSTSPSGSVDGTPCGIQVQRDCPQTQKGGI